MRSSSAAAALLIGVAALAGCASLDPRDDEAALRSLLTERSQTSMDWAQDETADRVPELLKTELTPASAVQVAFLRNQTLQSLVAQIGIARAEWVQATRIANPELSGNARFAVQGSGTGVDLDLIQDFLSVLKLPLRKQASQAELEATKLEIGAALLELAAQVREAFFEAQAAEQTLELRQKVAESAALAVDVSRRQLEAGNITDLEHATQESLLQEAKLALAEAELAVIDRRERLTALLGLFGSETQWTIGRRLPALPAQEPPTIGLESLAVERRLDLAAARQRALAAASSPALHRFWAFLPGGLGAAAEREVESGDWSVGPAIDFTLPLFGQGQAERVIARGKARQSEAAFAALAVQIRSDVRRAEAALAASRSRVLYYEKAALPLRARILEATQRRYNGMLVGVYELLQAKREQIETGAAYVQALRDYWFAHIALERALGTELPPATNPRSTP